MLRCLLLAIHADSVVYVTERATAGRAGKMQGEQPSCIVLTHAGRARTDEIEPERERGGDEIAPAIRVAPDDLEPDTLRAVIESFVLREGTDYGEHETSLETKVAQVLRQLRRGEAHITFDPATESVNVVVTSATGG